MSEPVKPTRILVVEEDQRRPRDDTKEGLARSGPDTLAALLNKIAETTNSNLTFDVTHAKTPQEAIDALQGQNGAYDIILTDSMLRRSGTNDMTSQIAKILSDQKNDKTLLIQTDVIPASERAKPQATDSRIDVITQKPRTDLPKLLVAYANGELEKNRLVEILSKPTPLADRVVQSRTSSGVSVKS